MQLVKLSIRFRLQVMINFSFSGLPQQNAQGTITDFYPSFLILSNPPIVPNEVVKSVSYVPVANGVLATYDLGLVSNGYTGNFSYSTKFGPGRVNNRKELHKPLG